MSRIPQYNLTNMNYYPSLNNKFRKRIMSKPIRFNQQKLSKLNKLALSSGLMETNDIEHLSRSTAKASKTHLLK